MDSFLLHEEELEIILPKTKEDSYEQPLLLSVGPSLTMALPIIIMAIFGSSSFNGTSVNGIPSHFGLTMVITAGATALLTTFWGIANHVYRKKMRACRIQKENEEYDEYIKRTRKYLTDWAEYNLKVYERRYPKVCDMINDFDEKNLFKRYILDEDFLFVRIGTGRIPSPVKVKTGGKINPLLIDDSCLKAQSVVNDFEFLENAPTGINLGQCRQIGIALPREIESTYRYILKIILSIAYANNPNEVKLVIIADGTNRYQKKLCDTVRFLPHLFTNEANVRLISTRSSTLPFLISSVVPLINPDNECHYIFFLLSPESIREEVLFEILSREDRKMNFSALFLESRIKFPNCVKTVVQKEDFDLSDIVGDKAANAFVRKLAQKSPARQQNIPIPKKVDFLKLYGVSSADMLRCEDRWQRSNTKERLKVPIGFAQDNQRICLDIHEKFHGPHGLVAGMTGAGKSELLQTIVMSLCVSFSPEAFNFFIIDYKGGGTGNIIDELPHCVGSISNLSGNSIQRAMLAIGSEVVRRQKLFSEFGVNHIDDYIEATAQNSEAERVAHLLLIIDEFAELKKEEPDFMRQVISLAAVGRSLGIHLILATQKPAGVVDEKIRCNTRYSLCLKVQDKQDSLDMLNTSDAAYLLNPGRCILKIGNGEYYKEFQTGYCGGEYSVRNDSDKVLLMDETAQRKGLEKHTVPLRGVKELSVLTEYIKSIASTCNFKATSLWLPELNDMYESPDCADGSFPIGIYDDPVGRVQQQAEYDAEKDGHLAVIGAPGSGKSNLLYLLAGNVKTEDEYVFVDIGNEFSKYNPQKENLIGRVNNVDDIAIFLYHLKKEFQKRKSAHSGKLFIFIDNFDNFWKSLREDEADSVKKMIAEGIGADTYFILSATSVSEIPGSIFAKIKSSIALELNDKYSYQDALRQLHLKVFPKSNTPGRCLLHQNDGTFECQIYKTSKEIVKASRRIFPSIPNPFNVTALIDKAGECAFKELPIGCCVKSARMIKLNANNNESFLISGRDGMGQREILSVFKTVMCSDWGLREEEILFYTGEEASKISKEVLKRPDEYKVWLICDLGRFFREMFDENQRLCEEEGKTIRDISPVFVAAYYNPEIDTDVLSYPQFRQLFKKRVGIHLGGCAHTQRFLCFDDISYSKLTVMGKPGEGLLKLAEHDKTIEIKTPVNKEEEDDYD